QDAIAEGGYYGMQTFDQSLLQLVLEDVVTVDEAMFHSSSKQNFALLLEANNVRIDRTVRRAASGSHQAHDELTVEKYRPPVQTPVPVAPPSAAPVQPAATDGWLPSIAGGQAPLTNPFGFPGVTPQEAHPDPHAAGPQQPRPQPGIHPDL